jgi:hypothetical protein
LPPQNNAHGMGYNLRSNSRRSVKASNHQAFPLVFS